MSPTPPALHNLNNVGCSENLSYENRRRENSPTHCASCCLRFSSIQVQSRANMKKKVVDEECNFPCFSFSTFLLLLAPSSSPLIFVQQRENDFFSHFQHALKSRVELSQLSSLILSLPFFSFLQCILQIQLENHLRPTDGSRWCAGGCIDDDGRLNIFVK